MRTEIKNSMDGSIRVTWQPMSSETEGRISELGDRTIEITQFEQQRENRLKKRNSEVCGSITEGLTFMTLSLEGEKERWC